LLTEPPPIPIGRVMQVSWCQRRSDYNSLLSSYSQAAKLAQWGIPEPAASGWKPWPKTKPWPDGKSAGSPWRWKCFSATSCRKHETKKRGPHRPFGQWGHRVVVCFTAMVKTPPWTPILERWMGLLLGLTPFHICRRRRSRSARGAPFTSCNHQRAHCSFARLCCPRWLQARPRVRPWRHSGPRTRRPTRSVAQK
jgi:hypothetical protein